MDDTQYQYCWAKKDLVLSKVLPTSEEMGENREFYATLRFAYLRVVKRLKVVQKINWLMGLEFDFIPKLDSELVLVIIDHPQWLNLSKRRIAK